MWSDFQKTTLNFSGLAVVGSYDYIQVSAACPPSPAVLLNLTNPTTEGQLTGLTEGCKHTLSATAYCGTSAGTVQTATTKEQCTRKCMLARIVKGSGGEVRLRLRLSIERSDVRGPP